MLFNNMRVGSIRGSYQQDGESRSYRMMDSSLLDKSVPELHLSLIPKYDSPCCQVLTQTFHKRLIKRWRDDEDHLAQGHDDATYPLCGLLEGFVTVGPTRHWSPISWKDLQWAEGSSLPINRTENNWDHHRFASFVSSQCLLHFDTIAILRGEEIRTH